MALPTILVEAAFGSTPLGTRSWTDITNAVRSMSLTRGKDHILAAATAGKATFTLNNRDRRFDPSNTSSPFYPNLKIRTPIRASVNATVVWMGFVRRWDPQWPDGVNSDTIVEAVGILDFVSGMRGVTLPESAWEMIVRTTSSKRSWWRLGEAAGATVAVDQIAGIGLNYVNALLAQTGLVVGSSDTAAKFNGTFPSLAYTLDQAASLTVGSWTVVATIAQSSNGGVIAAQNYDNGTSYFTFSTNAAGHLFATITSPTLGTVNLDFDLSSSINDGKPHQVALVKSGTTVTVYYDGSPLAPTGTLSAATGLPAGPFTIGGVFTQNVGFAGTLDEVVTFDRALSAAEVYALYNARQGWPLDDTGSRIVRILDYLGITSADRQVNTGGSNTIMQAEANLGTDALSKLEECRRTENGDLFEGHDGRIMFQGRQQRMVPPYTTSQATFSNSNTATNPIKAGGTAAPLDDQDMFNDVPVSRRNGAEYRAGDATSQTNNGAQSLTGFTDLPLAYDADVVDAANWLLFRFKNPRQRLNKLVIDALANSGLINQVVNREIGDRITVTHQPPGGGPAFTSDQIIEGITHEISVDGGLRFTTTYASSPADPAPYFVFDDANLGKFDTSVFAY